MQKYGFKTTTPDVSVTDALFRAHNPDILHALDPTNISRLGADLGALNDPQTGNPGNPVLDFIIANVGTWKSYPATGVRYFANQQSVEKEYQEKRAKHSKNLQAYIANGQEDMVLETFRRVQSIFNQQYEGNPHRAYREFRSWIKPFKDSLAESKLMTGLSKEELDKGIAESFAAQEVSIAMQTRREALEAERKTRLQNDMRRKFGSN